MSNVKNLVAYSNKILGYEKIVDDHAFRIASSIEKEGKEANYDGRSLMIDGIAIPLAKEIFIKNNAAELLAHNVNDEKVNELLVQHIEELMRRGRFQFA